MFAHTIEDVSKINFKTLFDATESLSSSVTAEAMALNMTFPFVTLNNYEVFARDARLASKAEFMCISMRLSAQQIPEFNAYAPAKAQEWIATSQLLANQLEQTDTEYEPIQTLPFVYDTFVDINTGEQTISPTTTDAEVLWQTSPVIHNGFMLMSNLLGIETGEEVISPYVTIRTTQGM